MLGLEKSLRGKHDIYKLLTSGTGFNALCCYVRAKVMLNSVVYPPTCIHIPFVKSIDRVRLKQRIAHLQSMLQCIFFDCITITK